MSLYGLEPLNVLSQRHGHKIKCKVSVCRCVLLPFSIQHRALAENDQCYGYLKQENIRNISYPFESRGWGGRGLGPLRVSQTCLNNKISSAIEHTGTQVFKT